MKFQHAYRIPDLDDKGCASKDEYLAINSAGYYESDEPYGFTHRKQGRVDFHLVYNQSGTMKVRLNQTEHTVGSGAVFIYKPEEEQYYGQNKRDEAISAFWIHFTGYGVPALLQKAGLWERNLISPGVHREIPALFELIINELAEKQINHEALAAAFFQELLFILSRKLAILEQQKKMNNRDREIHRSLSYIHANYADKITVKQLAEQMGLRPNRYSSVFKQYTGYSPQQYLINYRMDKAMELLKHMNLNIRQISMLVGFEDQLHFSRLFKKYKQLSPLKFRNKE